MGHRGAPWRRRWRPGTHLVLRVKLWSPFDGKLIKCRTDIYFNSLFTQGHFLGLGWWSPRPDVNMFYMCQRSIWMRGEKNKTRQEKNKTAPSLSKAPNTENNAKVDVLQCKIWRRRHSNTCEAFHKPFLLWLSCVGLQPNSFDITTMQETNAKLNTCNLWSFHWKNNVGK